MRLLSICMELISAVIYLMPAIIILLPTVFKKSNAWKKVLIVIFMFYFAGVMSAVGLPDMFDMIYNPEFNFIPLIGIIANPYGFIRDTLLNILLFVPLGILLPVFCTKYQQLKYTVLVGFGISLAIEILQIYSYRLTDIDDLITNTVGVIIGFYISRKVREKLQGRLLTNEGIYTKYVPPVIFVIVFWSRFVIGGIVSSIIWSEILNSRLWEAVR